MARNLGHSEPGRVRGRIFFSAFIALETVCSGLLCWNWYDGDGRDFGQAPMRVNSRLWVEVNYDTRQVVVQVNPSCGKVVYGSYNCHHAREIDRRGTLYTWANSAVISENARTGVVDLRVSARDAAFEWSPATSAHITLDPRGKGTIIVRRSSYPSAEVYYYRPGRRTVFTKREKRLTDMFFPMQETHTKGWPDLLRDPDPRLQ
jgi:hypothetical protein